MERYSKEKFVESIEEIEMVQENYFWAELEEIDCPCQGNGWANINNKWEECPMHFMGQLYPESRELLLCDPILLADSEKKSILNWRISQARDKLLDLQVQVRHALYNIHVLELEQVNKTPTIQMQSVKIPDNCYTTVQMKAVRLEEHMKYITEECNFTDTF